MMRTKKREKCWRTFPRISYSDVYDIFQNRLAEEGVSGGDYIMSPALSNELFRKQID
jgi:hypothetical protein